MNTSWQSKLLPATLLLFYALTLTANVHGQVREDSAKLTDLLTQARTFASRAEKDADRLASFTRTTASWDSHATQVNAIREHVNGLGRIVQQLNEFKAEGSAWQQEAIGRIQPLLNEMASHLSSTIDHMNAHRSRIHDQAYRDFAMGNYDLAQRTSQTIRDFVDYGQTKAKAERLESKLEVPAQMH